MFIYIYIYIYIYIAYCVYNSTIRVHGARALTQYTLCRRSRDVSSICRSSASDLSKQRKRKETRHSAKLSATRRTPRYETNVPETAYFFNDRQHHISFNDFQIPSVRHL